MMSSAGPLADVLNQYFDEFELSDVDDNVEEVIAINDKNSNDVSPRDRPSWNRKNSPINGDTKKPIPTPINDGSDTDEYDIANEGDGVCLDVSNEGTNEYNNMDEEYTQGDNQSEQSESSIYSYDYNNDDHDVSSIGKSRDNSSCSKRNDRMGAVSFRDSDDIIYVETQPSVHCTDNDTDYLANSIHDIHRKPSVGSNIPIWRAKATALKKKEALDELKKLRSKALFIEKDKRTQLYAASNRDGSKRRGTSATKGTTEEYSELENAELMDEQQRHTEKAALTDRLMRIRAEVDRFQRQLTEGNPGSHAVEKLKIVMEKIEASFLSFKEKQRGIYEFLMREELSLKKDIDSFTQRIETWDHDTRRPSHHITSTLPVASTSDNSVFLPEVIALEDHLRNHGGRLGGWDEHAHYIFMKLRQKHGNRHREFLSAAQAALVDKTRSEIEAHDSWLREHNRLTDERRKAISVWRSEQDAQKRHERDQRIAVNQCDEKELRKVDPQERLAFERKQAEAKARVRAWHMERELEAQHRIEEEELSEIQRRYRNEVTEIRRREEKSKLKQYQQQRQVEKRLTQAEKELAERRKRKVLSRDDVLALHSRDIEIVQQQKARMTKRLIEEEEKQKRLTCLRGQVKLTTKRDPSRLTQPTQASRSRTRKDPDSTSTKFNVCNPPTRRAVPTWRKGM